MKKWNWLVVIILMIGVIFIGCTSSQYIMIKQKKLMGMTLPWFNGFYRIAVLRLRRDILEWSHNGLKK